MWSDSELYEFVLAYNKHSFVIGLDAKAGLI
jgi:hypothetical protein